MPDEAKSNFEGLEDLMLPNMALPFVGARFVAGVDREGKRTSSYHFQFDEETVTPIEVVGLVVASVFEWYHTVLHDQED